MKNIGIVAVLLVLLLSSCGWTKKDLGLEHRGPNETNVKVNNPLILPPEYSVRPTNAVPYSEEDTATEE
ncbi:MAG: hypothetical protein IJ099_02585 [Alphaproteobacteria bacterium]|nr:hypothetical protein [Alphaproteobacteria bacterium]